MPTATRKRTSPTHTRKATVSKEERQAEASELHRAIAERVNTLANSEEWLAYLGFLKSFHRYSLNNIMLMMSQAGAAGRTSPTLVAGYQAWLDKGYQVSKGQKGMRIFGFSKKLVVDDAGQPVLDDKGKKQFRVFFPIVSVFDVTQTEPVTEPYTDARGRTIPAAQPLDTFDPQVLEGDDVLGITERVAAFVRSRGWSFSIGEVADHTNGYTTLDGSKQVVVHDGLTPAQQAKTALHEAAHMLMHANDAGHPVAKVERSTCELEAESVAYVVGAMLGLDTEQYSDRYLLRWGAGAPDTGAAIKATADRVNKTVRQLFDALSGESEA